VRDRPIPPRQRQPGTYDRKDRWGTKQYGTSRQQREQILARDDYTCVYCGAEGTVVDHVVPVHLGGKSRGNNLVAACIACNKAKAARWDWPGLAVLAESDHKNARVARKMIRGTELRRRLFDD
jgi:5-methylcytosine-specific restriction endonuclease McrA